MSDRSNNQPIEDETNEPVTWEMRYERRLGPNGSWRKARSYVFGTFEHVSAYANGYNSSPDRVVLSLKMRPKIHHLTDLTDSRWMDPE